MFGEPYNDNQSTYGRLFQIGLDKGEEEGDDEHDEDDRYLDDDDDEDDDDMTNMFEDDEDHNYDGEGQMVKHVRRQPMADAKTGRPVEPNK